MKNTSLSTNQYFTLMYLFLTSTATLSSVGRRAGKDMWFVLLIGLLISIILYTIFFRISYRHNFASFEKILQQSYGKFLGNIITICYMGYFFYMGARVLKDTIDMITFTIMRNSNTFILSFIFMIAIVYAVLKGITNFARCSEIILMVLMVFLIVIGLSMSFSGHVHLDYLRPILETDPELLLEGIKVTTQFPFGEVIVFLPLLYFIPVSNQKKIYKTGLSSLLLAGFSLIFFSILGVGILGPTLIQQLVYPFYNAVKMIGVGVVFERLDSIAVVVLVGLCFFKVLVYFFSTAYLVSTFNKKLNYQNIAIPLGIVFTWIATNLSDNRIIDLYFSLDFDPKYIQPIFIIAIPLLTWIISEVKFRKQKMNP